MSNLNETSNSSNNEFLLTTSFHGNRLKFSVLLIFQLISFISFIFVFQQFASKKRLRSTIHNDVIILLLITSFIFITVILSFTLSYMYTSTVRPASESFCTFWNWFHYSVNIVNLFLMAFASLERNWLIFHPNVTRNLTRRVLLHYTPLSFCILYPPSFYFFAMYVHRCQFDYDFSQLLCKWPCYFYNEVWSRFDLFFNNYVPLFSIPLFCAIIYVRLVVQRRQLKLERFKWTRDKKLILQIWALSSLYLAMWMPLQLSGLINLYWLPTFLVQEQIDYMFLFPYFVHLLYPFIVILSFHHEMLKRRRHGTTIHPMNVVKNTAN